MEIVKLQKSEIKNALELIWFIFQEFEAPDYSEHGVSTFKDFIFFDSIIEKVNKGNLIFWGCFKLNKLVGVIAIIDINHICLFFVKKEYQRQGIAKKLFQTVADYCKIDDNINNITVNSSPYAVEVYHHLGFKDTNTEQTVDGIRFTPMEYPIA